MLALAERLERRRVRRRRNRGVGPLHGHRIGAGSHPLATLRSGAGLATKLAALDLHGVGDALRAGEHARPHLEGRHRGTIDRGDASRRDAGVDAEAAAAAGRQRAVHQHRAAHETAAAAARVVVPVRRRQEQITRRDEGPVHRTVVVVVDDVVRRQRRPADRLVAVAPVHPGRRPLVPGNPEPAELRAARPAAVVERDPAPVFFILLRDPVPAPIVRIDPVADGVGTPAGRPLEGHPHFAPARVGLPHAVGLEREMEIADLGRLRLGRA